MRTLVPPSRQRRERDDPPETIRLVRMLYDGIMTVEGRVVTADAAGRAAKATARIRFNPRAAKDCRIR